MVVVFVIIGTICVQIIRVPPGDFTQWEGRQIICTGKVVGKEARITAGGEVLVVTVKPDASAEGLPEYAKGKVLCYLKSDNVRPLLGSKVRIQGKLSCFEKASNPGQFSQAEYYQILKTDYRLFEARILAAGRSYSIYRESLFRIKNAFGQTLNQFFSEENASVLRTMLLGESGQTDNELKDLYQRNGIVHILAISGLHISLIGMSLYRLLRRIAVPIPIAAPLAVVVMVSYGVMTDMSTSSLRAVVMFGLRMSAHLVGRTYDLLTALAAAAVLILLEQPLYLNHSGFLFSFLAVLAISLFIPSMDHSLFNKAPPKTCENIPVSTTSDKTFIKPFAKSPAKPFAKSPAKPFTKPSANPPVKFTWFRKIAKAFLSGLCISAFTLPVYACFYYQFPLYSVLLNLIVIPLMSVLMMTGILTMLVGPLFVPFGKITSAISILILAIYKNLCLLCDKLPYSNLILGKPRIWQVVIYTGVLISLILFHKKLRVGIRYLILMAGIMILVLRTPSGMTVTFLDVGQGDCIYIRSPAGRHYLIDAGSSDRQEVGRYRILPYLKSQGVRRLDALFITHPDKDHHSAFFEMTDRPGSDGIPIDALILPDISDGSKNEDYRNLEKTAAKAGITRYYIGSGQSIAEADMTVWCLHPESGSDWPDSNAYSTVLLVKYGNFTMLLTGDVEGRGEAELNQYITGVLNDRTNDNHISDMRISMDNLTMLKVSHHGSRNSTGTELLRLTEPAYAVISAGKGNSYGHPHEELMERLIKSGIQVYITYKSGAITIRTDGIKMEIEEYSKRIQ